MYRSLGGVRASSSGQGGSLIDRREKRPNGGKPPCIGPDIPASSHPTRSCRPCIGDSRCRSRARYLGTSTSRPSTCPCSIGSRPGSRTTTRASRPSSPCTSSRTILTCRPGARRASHPPDSFLSPTSVQFVLDGNAAGRAARGTVAEYSADSATRVAAAAAKTRLVARRPDRDANSPWSSGRVSDSSRTMIDVSPVFRGGGGK